MIEYNTTCSGELVVEVVDVVVVVVTGQEK